MATISGVPADRAVTVRCAGTDGRGQPCHRKLGELSSPFVKVCDKCGTVNQG